MVNNDNHLYIIDPLIRSRDLKRLIKRIKPIESNKYSVYLVRENTVLYKVLVLGKPNVKYYSRRKYDVLSGLTYRIREALIKHLGRDFIEVHWDGSYYRVKIKYSPLTIRIVVNDYKYKKV